VESALAGARPPAGGSPPTRGRSSSRLAHPVFVEDEVRGVVLVEQTTNDVLAVRNREFGKLFAAILAVSLLGALALPRLRRAPLLSDPPPPRRGRGGRSTARAGSAAPCPARPPGTRSATSPGASPPSSNAQRQHTAYLEQVGNRLSHEIRTPVGVVRSSLDNLRVQPLPAEARVYIARADEGLTRLATMLARMSEATRLETSLASTERERFDLAAVARAAWRATGLANPGREIRLRVPGEPVPVLGAPDLAAQLLDKLVDNALGFARPGTPVR